MRYFVTGITLLQEAKEALKNGACALGFDLAKPGSANDAESLREIIKKLPPFIAKAGIFADKPRYEVEELITFLDLDTLVFTGSEDTEYLKRWYGQKIIKKMYLGEGLIIPSDYPADAFLVDADDKGFLNGSYTKPLIVSVYTMEDYLKAKELAPWAVQVFCQTPFYEAFSSGRYKR